MDLPTLSSSPELEPTADEGGRVSGCVIRVRHGVKVGCECGWREEESNDQSRKSKYY